jgi:hypothetical protein
MRMLVRGKRALTDPAHHGKPENRLPLAYRAIASPIARSVNTQIICTRMIALPRQLDFT